MPHKSLEVTDAPKVLIWARESIRRNIEEVAKKLNISEDIVSKWETGPAQRKLTLVQIEKYAYPFNSQGYHILCHALFLFGMFGCTHSPFI